MSEDASYMVSYVGVHLSFSLFAASSKSKGDHKGNINKF